MTEGTMAGVKVWEEDLIIPTYRPGDPEKAPLFLEKRTYQGSTGKVYPWPVTEKIADEKEDVRYKAVWLENEYLKVMILPELGGRIQRALDKTNGYDFVYYNRVIKPALVGLTGPWISGGIEFNWPQHHRPSTYAPVDYTLRENGDGSCTVFLSEIDRMYGTRGTAAITLHPGRAYIEIRGRLYNHTDLPQTFLWWANPAVPANDHTYSVFPPDVNAVMDHGRRAVSTFPVATGEYYKYDYSAGVDISRFRNIKVPTSYMAAHSDYDFIGNYDESLEAGLLHVADHHISPGKKQWTWGNSDFGQVWHDSLTDEDGPYIELMTGVFTDNQPDFSWLKPHEEKTFVQYFMPYKGVGRVGNATRDAALSLSRLDEGRVSLRVYATAAYPDARVKVIREGRIIQETAAALSPQACFEAVFELEGELADTEITVEAAGKTLAAYTVYREELQPVPDPAEALPAPPELKSTEDLFLAALHLEQYRHATYEPADYYLEGLKRDPSDSRLNIGYGRLLLRRGRIRESIGHFEAAVKKLTWKNPNPYSGEAYFNLGLALEADGQADKAYDAFYKATWSAETQNPAFYWLACLEARQGNYEAALGFTRQSLVRNGHDMKCRLLQLSLLRALGKPAGSLLDESLEIDPLYPGLLYEKSLQGERQGTEAAPEAGWTESLDSGVNNLLETAILYIQAGFHEDALRVLGAGSAHPLLRYYAGYVYALAGREDKAREAFRAGESMAPDFCFPNKLIEVRILETAVRLLPEAPLARYYLGNLLYDMKQYGEAIRSWEAAVREKPELAPGWRNLSFAYYNKRQAPEQAMAAIQRACELDPHYPRYWLEYDQLAARLGVPTAQRLAVMEDHPEIVKERDDLWARYIGLLNDSGRYREALAALAGRRFHPWEGGEGRVSGEYRRACIALAQEALDQDRAREAIPLLEQAIHYPRNLGEGKLPNVPDNEIHYYLGRAYKMLGERELAAAAWEQAAGGSQIPETVRYYNDQPSDYIYFQGLALLELGRREAALKSFHQLIRYGERHIFDTAAHDYFAVSVPQLEVYEDDLQALNEAYCRRLIGLGQRGLAAAGH